VFIHGFSPAVGTNIYIADAFDDAVFSLFDLSVERLSLALREKASKQLVRLMQPANQDGGVAHETALNTIKKANTDAYLVSAAIAVSKAQNLGSTSANHELLNVLDSLRKQGNIYSNKLNPLGYDERFVPMQDYRVLYETAMDRLSDVAEAEIAFDNEKREFDANWEQLQGQVDALISQYVPSLASLTGCPQPTDLDDPAQTEAFLICTGESGGDLFDCRLNQTASDFEACVSAAQTGGMLAQKYRAIREAQTRIDAARLRHDNIFSRMDMENEKAKRLIEIKRNHASAQATLFDEYLKKLKKARTITDTVRISSVRNREDGDWGSKTKTRDHATTTTFTIKDEKLDLETAKAKELLALTTEFDIQQINTQTAFLIKDLLLSAAEAEIEIELAIQQKNSIIADFDNAYQEKENLWYRYQRAQGRLSYFTDQVATLRILQSQAAIDLSEDLNYAVHHAYLAAKALEYQRVSDSGLALTNLFKVQTHDDLQEYLNGLDDVAVSSCQWGSVDSDYDEISLAYHILGLTDAYLDPEGDGMAAGGKSLWEARVDAVRSFINTNMNDEGNLAFSFSIADNASFLSNSRRYNLKLWNGGTLPPCDQPPNPVKGVAVNIVTDQGIRPRPRVRLRKNGHSTLRDAFGDIQEYISYTDFYRHPQEPIVLSSYREGEFSAFVNEEDVQKPTGSGTWTGSFKGLGITSSEWVIEIFDDNVLYPPTDFNEILDIRIHMHTIGECCF
jgi:hypothetical protein